MAREGVMLCEPFEEETVLNFNIPWLVQPKLRGIRCRKEASKSNKEVVLKSSSNNVIVSVPHINEALRRLFVNRIELDGELYIHNVHQEIIFSIVSRTRNIYEQHVDIGYYIFDIVNGELQRDRIVSLIHLSQNFQPPIYIVPTYSVCSLKELYTLYTNLLNEGYEGIVVRNPLGMYVRKHSKDILKHKPMENDIYKIIDIIEALSVNERIPTGIADAFVCVTDDLVTFKVSAGSLTKEERKFVLNNKFAIIGMYLEIKYEYITRKGVLYAGLALSIKERK